MTRVVVRLIYVRVKQVQPVYDPDGVFGRKHSSQRAAPCGHTSEDYLMQFKVKDLAIGVSAHKLIDLDKLCLFPRAAVATSLPPSTVSRVPGFPQSSSAIPAPC